MSDSSPIPIRHDSGAHRFVADVAGGHATVAYERFGNHIIFTHGSVPPEAEGQGVASALAREALTYARRNALQVVAHCPFMIAYLERHPEYDDLR